KHILNREHGVRRRRNAAREGARHSLRKESRCMAGEMAEEVSPQVAGNADERRMGNNTGEAPQPAIRRDEGNEQPERRPYVVRAIAGARQSVNEQLDAILRANRACDRGQDRDQDSGMRSRTLRDEPKCESDWTVGVPTDIAYCRGRRKI